MFSLGWSVRTIAYKLRSLHDLPEIAWLKPLTWLQKTSVLVLHGSDKKGFGNRYTTKNSNENHQKKSSKTVNNTDIKHQNSKKKL